MCKSISPKLKTYQICFSKRYRKLDPLATIFTTVRWLDSTYRLGNVYEIFYIVPPFHRKILLGSARLWKLELTCLDVLSDKFIFADADCFRAEFMEMMKGWYEKKPDWKGERSEIQVLHLMRVFHTSEGNILKQEQLAKKKGSPTIQKPLEVSV